MDRIVVGTDLGARSRAALEMAAQLAETEGAVLHLVCACSVPVAAAAEIEVMATASVADTVRSTGDELDGLAAEFRRRGIEVETHAQAGGAADTLCRVAETVGADLIVVGNKRMQGASRVLGSVANRVAHHAPCSVLIARTA